MLSEKNNFLKGFTLIEIIVVIAVIAVLTSIVAGSTIIYIGKSKDAAVKANVSQIVGQMRTYYLTAGSYNNFITPTVTLPCNEPILIKPADKAFAVYSKLCTSDKYWCADSTGENKEISEVPTFATCNICKDDLCPGHGMCVDNICTCKPGYSGTDCSAKVCSTATCVSPRSCNLSGECVCPEGFGGPTCNFTCNNHGTIVEGTGTLAGLLTCTCNGDYGGSNCQYTCNCSGHGNCSANGICGLCFEGYHGYNCEYYCSNTATPPTCGSHGSCDNSTGLCVCKDGYTGGKCETPPPACNCNSNGVCNTPGVCTCNKCWSGSDCSVQNTCSGNGDCNVLTGLCSCNKCWSGTTCSIENTCSGHGDCNGETGNCACDTGYSGSSCELECSGHGSLVNGVCSCNYCYSGSDCGIRNTCSGNGDCIDSTGNCSCTNPFYYGTNCEIFSPCNGHGTWDSGTQSCNCNTGYYSYLPNTYGYCNVCASGYIGYPNCVVDNSSQCSGHGSLVNGVCSCNKCWSGSDCSVQNTCSGNGSCSLTTGLCTCNKCWIGSTCSTQNTCSGHGSCSLTTGLCNCTPNSHYYGTNCNVYCDAYESSIFGCYSHGTCNSSGACVCTPGNNWYGTNCSVQCISREATCNGNGTCNTTTGLCNCDPDWYYDSLNNRQCYKFCDAAITCGSDVHYQCTNTGDCAPTGN